LKKYFKNLFMAADLNVIGKKMAHFKYFFAIVWIYWQKND